MENSEVNEHEELVERAGCGHPAVYEIEGQVTLGWCKLCRQEAQLEQEELEHEDYIKFMADGATTLTEVATRLRGHAAIYEQWEREGWQLSQPVDSGWLHTEKLHETVS